MLSVGGLFQIGDLAAWVVGLVLLELGEKKLISDTLGGSNSSLVLKNQERERTGIMIETGKYHVKKVGIETENGSDHGSILMKGSGIVTIERIDTTGTETGQGTETGKEIETVDVIEIGHGIVTGIETAIDIVKGIEIMKLGTLIDVHVIGSLNMNGLNLNRRGTNMGKGIVTMSLRMIVVGITSMSMDVDMLTLIMTLSSMTTTIMEMIVVIITISIMTMIGWKMTTMQDVQHLNHMKRRKVMVQTVNIVARRDLIPGSMTTRNWASYFSTLLVNIHHLVMFTSESCCPLLVPHPW